ncbi:hypothetical protein [Kineosporia sp. A_224]|uniref:hypothetical protein n=1 Tax=Kineosporia sp. A_224 TaxID=1962180 RepID=UPI001179D6AC|nr:hypothetical protein [Kineosporia sp. A_224]
MQERRRTAGQDGAGSDQRFDRSMRRLAHADLDGFCGLLGVELSGEVAPAARMLPTTFPGVTRTADLLVRTAPGWLLHVEYQLTAGKGLALRMLDYRAAIMTAHPGQHLVQVVVVLDGGRLDSVDSGAFRLGCRALYLREHPPDRFLGSPVLAPLASLGRGTPDDLARAYTQALHVIGTEGGDRVAELLESAATLATIRLDAPILDKIRREVGMTVESVAEFYAQTDSGKFLVERGREEGREEGREATLAELLRERFGADERIPALAQRLAHRPAALRAVLEAASLDDLDSSS